MIKNLTKTLTETFVHQRGQSITELLISIPVITAAVSGLLISLYYVFSFFQLRLNLQEALLCLHNNKNVQTCQVEFTQNIEGLLPIGEIEKILLQRNSLKLSGLAIFNIADKLKLDEFQELHLPLVRWQDLGDI